MSNMTMPEWARLATAARAIRKARAARAAWIRSLTGRATFNDEVASAALAAEALELAGEAWVVARRVGVRPRVAKLAERLQSTMVYDCAVAQARVAAGAT